MTQEEKDLLLKDLCARLPYRVKFACNKNVYTAKGLDLIVTDEGDWEYAVTAKGITPIEIDFIKPYLFPLSSINTELICKLNNLLPEYCRLTKNQIIGVSGDDYREIKLEQLDNLFKFFNLFHVDFRNLIEKGLANDATGLNIY